MSATVVLLNRDLRVHDHPALSAAAASASQVFPVFVIDDRMRAAAERAPNRLALLLDALRDLRESLRAGGGDLFVRRGDAVAEAVLFSTAAGAGAIYASADVSPFAKRRERRLAAAAEHGGLQFRLFPGITVVPSEQLLSSSGTAYRVFTPYWRAWQAIGWRRIEPSFRTGPLRHSLSPGSIPSLAELTDSTPSPGLPRGGEFAGREILSTLTEPFFETYDGQADLLPADATSRISAHLHFGTVSPRELAAIAERQPSGESFLRQLCWRDYFHQLLFHHPEISSRDFRPRRAEWTGDEDALRAWAEGRTGYPLIDAAMRQLLQEGWMHNRTRLLAASFLTKHLGVDWRLGAEHFRDWLVDGDVAVNAGNWQWAAGTGTDTRPNRILNPVRQARRLDPQGDYVRRYVPELSALESGAIHEPWKLSERHLQELGYPDRVTDHDAAAEAWRNGMTARTRT